MVQKLGYIHCYLCELVRKHPCVPDLSYLKQGATSGNTGPLPFVVVDFVWLRYLTFNQPIVQSFNQSILQSINQSFNRQMPQSTQKCGPIYKTYIQLERL